MFPDVADARGTVRTEHKGENFSDEVGVCLAFFHILATSGARPKSVLTDTTPYLAPRSLFVKPTTGTFLCKILPARAAVESARRYKLFV